MRAGRGRRLAVALLAGVAGAAALAAQPPACRTALDDGDFAFAAGCFIQHGERLLVVRHRFGGRLGVPAGRARDGESAQCVAHRETFEETGIAVIVHGKLRQFANGLALYRCEPVAGDVFDAASLPVPASGRNEISAVLWIDPRDTRPEAWRFPRDYPVLRRLIGD